MTTTPITGALVVIVGAAGIAAGALFLQADDTSTPTAAAGAPAGATAPPAPSVDGGGGGGGGGYGSSGGAATEATEGTGAAAATLEISGFQFGSVSVAAGGQVAVANRDSATHTVTATGGAFDTGQISGSSSDAFVAPDAPGSYPFRCQIHPDMTGTLTVG